MKSSVRLGCQKASHRVYMPVDGFCRTLHVRLQVGTDTSVNRLHCSSMCHIHCIQTITGGCEFRSATAGFIEIGGYGQFEQRYMQSVANHSNHLNDTQCGMPRDDAFHLFRHPVHSDNPWPGLVLQSSVGCVWYWCADQVS